MGYAKDLKETEVEECIARERAESTADRDEIPYGEFLRGLDVDLLPFGITRSSGTRRFVQSSLGR